MTRLHDYQADLIDQGCDPHASSSGGLPADYDTWRLATPPEYEEREERPPARIHLLPEGACGRRSHPWLCTLPAGHPANCNSLTEASARMAELIAAAKGSR
jgi:hypothetical protein